MSARFCLQLLKNGQPANTTPSNISQGHLKLAGCLKNITVLHIIVFRWHHHESLAGTDHTRDTCHVSPAVSGSEPLPAPDAGRGKHDGGHKRVFRDLQIIRVRVATKKKL